MAYLERPQRRWEITKRARGDFLSVGALGLSASRLPSSLAFTQIRSRSGRAKKCGLDSADAWLAVYCRAGNAEGRRQPSDYHKVLKRRLQALENADALRNPLAFEAEAM